MATAAVDTRHWTREDYEQLIADGYFRPGERVELVDGVIYEMPQQKGYHAEGVTLVDYALRSILPEGVFIRVQMPLALGIDSEPEPDIAVVRGRPGDYSPEHPTTAELVIEVADSSLYHDRKRKGSLYARVGIPEFWLLNLVKRRLEVYRDPKDGAYASRAVRGAGDTVSPLSRPDATIAVASLLPRR